MGRKKHNPQDCYVFERQRDGVEQCVYGPVDRKLAEHVADRGNKLRREGQHYPAYDVRVGVR